MTYQFSLRSFLLFVTGLAISLAAIVQVPHVFVFALSGVGVILASSAAYRALKNSRLRLSVVFASIVVWAVFYILSLGPFIALSEIEGKLTGQYHIGRLANAYRPLMNLESLPRSWFGSKYSWYISKWIPPDSAGLHVLYPPNISPDFVGTWQGENENTLSLRSDGTGRAHLGSDAKTHYFEWCGDANELALYQYTNKRCMSAWFGRELRNHAMYDKWDIVETSATQFELRDKAGKTFTFTRTQDKELESAP